eukprot:Skav216524  [mRNA]  locus=scaffold1003:34707:43368:+ [translate_table: standard]
MERLKRLLLHVTGADAADAAAESQEIEAVTSALREGWLAPGPRTGHPAQHAQHAQPVPERPVKAAMDTGTGASKLINSVAETAGPRPCTLPLMVATVLPGRPASRSSCRSPRPAGQLTGSQPDPAGAGAGPRGRQLEAEEELEQRRDHELKAARQRFGIILESTALRRHHLLQRTCSSTLRHRLGQWSRRFTVTSVRQAVAPRWEAWTDL